MQSCDLTHRGVCACMCAVCTQALAEKGLTFDCFKNTSQSEYTLGGAYRRLVRPLICIYIYICVCVCIWHNDHLIHSQSGNAHASPRSQAGLFVHTAHTQWHHHPSSLAHPYPPPQLQRPEGFKYRWVRYSDVTKRLISTDADRLPAAQKVHTCVCVCVCVCV
jgi:hypothetical protein